MIASTITANKEWEILFSEGSHWRIGAYQPRFRCADEIKELEQHTCPESFILLTGQITMIYKNADGKIQEKRLVPMELATFTEPHAGYSSDASGIALVTENAAFETIYTDIATGAITRRVTVAVK